MRSGFQATSMLQMIGFKHIRDLMGLIQIMNMFGAARLITCACRFAAKKWPVLS
jgi:hypothetical protein